MVRLPEGVSIENIVVDGANLILVQPDGAAITIWNAAVRIPTFVIGNVEIPQVALAAALEANGINVAAGPDGQLSVVADSPSSGGNFNAPDGNIGDAGPVIDLLPPTALQFGLTPRTELFPDLRRDDAPRVDLAPTGVRLLLDETDGEGAAGEIDPAEYIR